MIVVVPQRVVLIYRKSHVGYFQRDKGRNKYKPSLISISYKNASEIVKEGRGIWVNQNTIYLKYTKKEIRLAVYYRDNGICQYCNRELQIDDFTVEHIKARNYGGDYNLRNLVCSCFNCNNSRQHKGIPKETFRKLKRQARKHFNIDKMIENY